MLLLGEVDRGLGIFGLDGIDRGRCRIERRAGYVRLRN